MQISNIAFVNFTGYTQGGRGNQTASISCSNVYPCFNIALQNISLADSADGTPEPAQGSCSYIAPNGVSGLTGAGC
jgi:galacturan 1,4-alpha-galacturonidase